MPDPPRNLPAARHQYWLPRQRERAVQSYRNLPLQQRTFTQGPKPLSSTNSIWEWWETVYTHFSTSITVLLNSSDPVRIGNCWFQTQLVSNTVIWTWQKCVICSHARSTEPSLWILREAALWNKNVFYLHSSVSLLSEDLGAIIIILRCHRWIMKVLFHTEE